MGRPKKNVGHFRTELNRKAAQVRAEYRKELSAKDQIARLDRRLGKDVGASKERERLFLQVVNAKA